jgi:hypothetical protein
MSTLRVDNSMKNSTMNRCNPGRPSIAEGMEFYAGAHDIGTCAARRLVKRSGRMLNLQGTPQLQN